MPKFINNNVQNMFFNFIVKYVKDNAHFVEHYPSTLYINLW